MARASRTGVRGLASNRVGMLRRFADARMAGGSTGSTMNRGLMVLEHIFRLAATRGSVSEANARESLREAVSRSCDNATVPTTGGNEAVFTDRTYWLAEVVGLPSPEGR